MKILFLNIIITTCLYTFSHPIHVTVVNIEPNAKNALFEVSFKIFTDDLELAIFQHSNKNIGLTQNKPIQNIEHYLKNYINDNFKIILNGKKISFNKIIFVKYTIIEDATWIYLNFKISSKIYALEIYNNLLNDLYPDMTNLLIINWGNSEKVYTFAKNKTLIKIL